MCSDMCVFCRTITQEAVTRKAIELSCRWKEKDEMFCRYWYTCWWLIRHTFTYILPVAVCQATVAGGERSLAAAVRLAIAGSSVRTLSVITCGNEETAAVLLNSSFSSLFLQLLKVCSLVWQRQLDGQQESSSHSGKVCPNCADHAASSSSSRLRNVRIRDFSWKLPSSANDD